MGERGGKQRVRQGASLGLLLQRSIGEALTREAQLLRSCASTPSLITERYVRWLFFPLKLSNIFLGPSWPFPLLPTMGSPLKDHLLQEASSDTPSFPLPTPIPLGPAALRHFSA